MKLGVHFIDFIPGPPRQLGPTLIAAAAAAEQAGASMFTLADHVLQTDCALGSYPGQAKDPFLEGYTTLGFLAGHTSAITLGMLVSAVTFRQPAILAKAVATLDVLSQGRSMFGIGAAYYRREHFALGIPFPPLTTRLSMVEETIQICQQMWSVNDGPFEGKHFRLAETICQPQPIRPPSILIGGSGERKTLRVVARYADIWNGAAVGPERFEAKLDALEEHCGSIGRDPGEIRKTVNLFLIDPFEDIDSFLRTAERYAQLGVELVNVGPHPDNPDPVGYVRRLGDELIPRLETIG